MSSYWRPLHISRSAYKEMVDEKQPRVFTLFAFRDAQAFNVLIHEKK